MPYNNSLTPHDLRVLEKIRDPESAPSAPILIDATLPRDPNITNPELYDQIAASERDIVRRLQAFEARKTAQESGEPTTKNDSHDNYNTYISELEAIITKYPTYASAYNNHAQALRRKYGDLVLLKVPKSEASLRGADESEDGDLIKAAGSVLHDLNKVVSLLSPQTPFASISPLAAKTLAQAHTQRAALYHITGKQLKSNPDGRLRVDKDWTAEDLEELASRDFMVGGRYGNEIAKALAVATNPTAKLCGSIVQEALRKEYGSLVT